MADENNALDTFLGRILGVFKNPSERAVEKETAASEAENERHRKEMNKLESKSIAERTRLEVEQAQIQKEIEELEQERTNIEKAQAKKIEPLKKAEEEHAKNKAELEKFKEDLAKKEIEEQRKYDAEVKSGDAAGSPAPKKSEPITFDEIHAYSANTQTVPEDRKEEINYLVTTYQALTDNIKKSQNAVDVAQKSLEDSNQDRTDSEKEINNKKIQQAGIIEALDKINAPLLLEKDRHEKNKKIIEERGGKNDIEKAKIEQLSAHYENLIETSIQTAAGRENAREALAEAMQASTANGFMDKIRESGNFTNKEPQKLEKDGASGSGDYNIKIRINEDTQKPEAVITRSMGNSEKIVQINEAGVLDLSDFAGATVKISAEAGQYENKILLAGLERTNVEFASQRTGRYINGHTTNEMSPTKIFEIVGDEDGITKQRLNLAGAAADIEIARKEAKKNLLVAKAAFGGQEELNKLNEQIASITNGTIVAPQAIAGNNGGIRLSNAL